MLGFDWKAIRKCRCHQHLSKATLIHTKGDPEAHWVVRLPGTETSSQQPSSRVSLRVRGGKAEAGFQSAEDASRPSPCGDPCSGTTAVLLLPDTT